RFNPWASANTWRRRIGKSKSNGCRYKLFSSPNLAVHWNFLPDVREASILHLHWIADTLDFSRDLRNIDVPIVWTMHDQNPYLGGFHFQRDVDANPSMADLEARACSIKRKALANKRIAIVGNSEWNTCAATKSTVLPKETSYSTVYLPIDSQT